MIKIKKGQSPKILSKTGKTKMKELCSLYNKSIITSIAFDPNFDKSIYRHFTVLKKIKERQHEKCAYCESKFLHIFRGDIEHFRPKAGYQQDLSSTLTRPGYYWLAYEWKNLFFVCHACNEEYKKNFFPLYDTTKRATNHKKKITKENPLLIDPEREDPEKFINYREEVAYSVNGTDKGITTIKVLGLNVRNNLMEYRKEKLENIKILYNCLLALNHNDPIIKIIKLKLKNATLDSSEYANMLRCYFRDNGIFV